MTGTPSRFNGPSSVILSLWLPMFFFGHVFAGYWLVKAALLTNPQSPLFRLFRRQRKESLPKSGNNECARANSLDTSVLAEATEAATTAGRAHGKQQLIVTAVYNNLHNTTEQAPAGLEGQLPLMLYLRQLAACTCAHGRTSNMRWPACAPFRSHPEERVGGRCRTQSERCQVKHRQRPSFACRGGPD